MKITNNKNKSNSVGRRGRRGVGVIIGGVLLVGILLTSVFTFYVTILNNDRARSGYEIQSQQESSAKSTETYLVERAETVVAGSVDINVNNIGTIPMVASTVLVYCSSGAGCTNPGKPLDEATLSTVLNPGDSLTTNVGNGKMTGVADTYTVSVISERGNILSSTVCTLTADATCSEDGGDDAAGAEAIAQGTGSVQLDFQSFAVLFPDFVTRDTVGQTGRFVSASNVQGYPANNLYGDVNTIIIQRVRNLDENYDYKLTKMTTMITAFGGTKGNHPKPVFLCSSDDDNNPATRTPVTLPLTAYANDITLQRVDPASDTGWKNLYFCRAGDGSGNPTGAIGGWKPDVDYSLGINPIFMVMRATISGSLVEYAQTIPYQAFQLNGAADGTITEFTACSYGTSNSAASCQFQTTAVGGSPPPYDYTLTKGVTNYIHISHATTGANQGLGTSPYTIELIHPDGTPETLVSGATLNGNRNIGFTIPAGIDLSVTNYFAIKVTDNSGSTGSAHKTVFMTVHVT